MRDQVLPDSCCSLRRVVGMLERTYDEFAHGYKQEQRGQTGFKGTKNWKARYVTNKYWNYCDMAHLRQLIACAKMLIEANGALVPMSSLFEIAHGISATGRHVLTRGEKFYSDGFRSWLLRYLSPAVQFYVHRRGVARRVQTQVFFYMCPVDAASAANLKASFDTLLRAAEERSVEARLSTLRVREYLKLLPTRALQRVFRSFLLETSGSTSFLNRTFGLYASSLHMAKERVDLALLTSAELERNAPQFIDTGKRRAWLKDAREKVAEKLQDEHAGGVEALIEQCDKVGLDLPRVIESCHEDLADFSYEECARAVATGEVLHGSAAVGPRRDATREKGVERSGNCTWTNLAALVTLKLQKANPNLQIKEACLRTYCCARRENSIQGQRHATGSAAADVGVHRIQRADEQWNVDHVMANSAVAGFETRYMQMLEAGVDAAYVKWDDCSKIEADKARGWNSVRTFLRKSKLRLAPYSDMGKGVALGGCKVICNSILMLLPVGTDPHSSTSSTSRRGQSEFMVEKRPFGVARLENERRSTPTQAFNDFRLVLSMVPWLSQFFHEKCVACFWLSDGGWDHQPRNDEVQFNATRHHLECDRDYDAAFCRANGASAKNEAERVNKEERAALCTGASATATPFSRPDSAAQLQQNRRGFLFGVVNLLGRALYAGTRLLVFASYPGCQGNSDEVPEAEREALRAIAAAAPSKREGMPYYEKWANIERYKELHMLPRHYSFQIMRHECRHSLHGGLCCASDYPYPGALHFKPCDERPLRLPDSLNRWHPERLIVPDPRFDPKPERQGKYVPSADMDEAAAGLDKRQFTLPPGQGLKAFAKVNGLSPSPGQVKVLAKTLLGTEEKAEDVERWFSEKRMMRIPEGGGAAQGARRSELGAVPATRCPAHHDGGGGEGRWPQLALSGGRFSLSPLGLSRGPLAARHQEGSGGACVREQGAHHEHLAARSQPDHGRPDRCRDGRRGRRRPARLRHLLQRRRLRREPHHQV